MPARKKSRGPAKHAPVPQDEPRDQGQFPPILALVLAEDPSRLDTTAKKLLRLTCKAARAAVDPYLTKLRLYSLTTDLPAVRRSPWAQATTCLELLPIITRPDLRRLATLRLPQLRSLTVNITSGALDLFPRRAYPALTRLDLTVLWDHTSERALALSFKPFTRCTWPLQELVIDVTHDEDAIYDMDEDDEVPEVDIGAAAVLLRAFPQLRSLEVVSPLSPEDVRRFAAIRHERLETVNLNTMDQLDASTETVEMLAAADWPALRDLTVSGVGHICEAGGIALSGAAWIKSLRALRVNDCSICRGGALNLMDGLAGGALETLTLDTASASVLLALRESPLPRLRSLNIQLQPPDPAEGAAGAGANDALDALFGASLPALEELTASWGSYASGFFMQRQIWDRPPATPGASALPALRRLSLGGMHVRPACAAWLATGPFTRGVQVDLNACVVDCGRDTAAFGAMLSRHHISKQEYDAELMALGLHARVYWFNLLPQAEMERIAVSVFVRRMAREVRDLVEPVREAAAAAAGLVREGGDERLEGRYTDLLAALGDLNGVLALHSGGGGSGSGRRRSAR